MKSFFIGGIFLFVLSSNLFSQENSYYLPRYFHQESDSVVLTNGGNVRQSPSRNAKSIAKLEVGAKVLITGEAIGEETIFGLTGEYFPIRYVSKGVEINGYMWSGLFAYTWAKDKEGNEYAIGAKRLLSNSEYDEVEYNLMRRDVKSGKIYQQLVLRDVGEQSWFESKVLGGMGLTNVQAIFRVGFLGEACGVASTHYYYAWSAGKFVELPSKSSVGDAGVYYSGDKLLFPTEHKYGANLIVVETEEAETEFVYFVEGIEVLEEVIHKTQRWFRWDGKHYEELEKKHFED